MPSFFMDMDTHQLRHHKKITLWRLNFFLFIFLSFLVTLIYLPGLNGPFLLDDLQSIAPAKMQTFSWQKLLEISLQNTTGPLGRPITVATFALNQWLLGSDPYYFKVVNLSIHLITGFSIGIFVYLLLSFMPQKRRFSSFTAWLTTILWLIHPLQLSTVLYAVQRMTQLSALFTIVGLNLYLMGRQRQWTHQSGQWFILASIFIFFPLAVFSKETGLLFPWYLFCIEYFILRFSCTTKRQSQRLFYSHLIFSTSLLVGAVSYFYLKFDYFQFIYNEKNITILSRLLTESKVLIFYVSLIFRPLLGKMGLYHDDYIISTTLDSITLISLSFLLIIFVTIFYCRRKAPIVSFGLSWFLISHAIESTVLPLELVFEHRNYIGMIGLLLIPSYYLVQWCVKSRSFIQKISFLFIIFLVGILSTLTFLRSLSWSNSVNFLSEVNRYHPRSARVHIEMGNWFLSQKQYSLAMKELNLAEQLQPNNVGILLHKILVGCQTRYVANISYQMAISSIRKNPITPYSIMVLNQMINNMVSHQCQTLDLKKIELIIQSALQNPSLHYKPLYKAVLYHLQAGIAFMEGDIIRCNALLLASYEAYPSRLDPLIQKALIEWGHGMPEEAKNTLSLIHKNAQSIKAPHDKIKYLDQLFQTR